VDECKPLNGGAVEAVEAAMRTHPLSDRVQAEACIALGAMTSGNAGTQIRAAAAGAVEAVVAAMVGRCRLNL